MEVPLYLKGRVSQRWFPTNQTD